MDENQIKVSSIEIEVNGVKISLSQEDAKKLKDVLNDLFKTEYITIPNYDKDFKPFDNPWNKPYITYCGDTKNTAMLSYKLN